LHREPAAFVRIVVTGAAQGIGRVISESFVRDGARVAGIDIQPCADTASACGPSFRGFAADIANELEVARAFIEIDEWFAAAPDILCNVAATYAIAPFVETPLDAFDQVMAVNVRGAFICSQQSARRMSRAGGGRIINITSTESVQAFALASVYGASKAALAHLTKSMAVELARDSILVNAVAPGAIATPSLLNTLAEMPVAARHDLERTPIGRLGTPEDVVAAVRFLAYHAAWTTGQTIYVDGGFLAAGLPMLVGLEATMKLPESWFKRADDVDA
jgi:NAD(P)-dependent dehydrogenase (short-subunit alcohol dehydrogenase family)